MIEWPGGWVGICRGRQADGGQTSELASLRTEVEYIDICLVHLLSHCMQTFLQLVSRCLVFSGFLNLRHLL